MWKREIRSVQVQPSDLVILFQLLVDSVRLCCGCFQVESADLETENNHKAVDQVEEEEEGAVANLSPATSSASLYASEKFYSDAESDDDYKDPLPDFYPQSKSFHQVCISLFDL